MCSMRVTGMRLSLLCARRTSKAFGVCVVRFRKKNADEKTVGDLLCVRLRGGRRRFLKFASWQPAAKKTEAAHPSQDESVDDEDDFNIADARDQHRNADQALNHDRQNTDPKSLFA